MNYVHIFEKNKTRMISHPGFLNVFFIGLSGSLPESLPVSQ